jgi:2-dehydropantoate 2-reductase
LARGAHLDAIRERGLQVKSIHGDFLIEAVKATDDSSTIGLAELVLVCVKDYQLDHVLPDMKQVVGQGTAVIPLLNGVRATERLAEELGRDRVLGGLCRVVSFKTAPGMIEQVSAFRSITFGEFNNEKSQRALAILQVLEQAEIEVELADDIRKAMWTKFLFIAAYSGLASVVRLPAGRIRSCPETMAMMQQAMQEIEAVARTIGVNLDADIVQKSMTFFDGFPDDATASMQRDVQDGRMFELEAMTGSVIRYGAESGISTPVNDFIYAVLKPLEMEVRTSIRTGAV